MCIHMFHMCCVCGTKSESSEDRDCVCSRQGCCSRGQSVTKSPGPLVYRWPTQVYMATWLRGSIGADCTIGPTICRNTPVSIVQGGPHMMHGPQSESVFLRLTTAFHLRGKPPPLRDTMATSYFQESVTVRTCLSCANVLVCLCLRENGFW